MRLNRAFRVTMIWQGAISVLIAGLGGVTTGGAAFLSAVLGGTIGMAGVLAFALMSMRRPGSGGAAVRTALRAEAVKVVVIVLLLWLVFASYRELVVLPFFGAFVVSVLLSGIAFAVSGD